MPDASKVGVAITGAVSKGPTTATAPTGTASALTGFDDLGYIGEDGVEIELPDAGDAEPIKAWQNGTTVRTIRTPSDDNPSWTFVLLETNKGAVETYFGVELTQTSTEGSFEYRVETRSYDSYVIDSIDGVELQRDYVPRGVVTSVEGHQLANGEPTVFGVTVEGELDTAKNYNFKRWATRLKTSA